MCPERSLTLCTRGHPLPYAVPLLGWAGPSTVRSSQGRTLPSLGPLLTSFCHLESSHSPAQGPPRPYCSQSAFSAAEVSPSLGALVTLGVR